MSIARGEATADEVRRAGVMNLSDISWRSYVALRDDPDFGCMRMVYDRGELQIMAPMPLHERKKLRLSRLMEAVFETLRIPSESLGELTCRREDQLRGIEPDLCYYFAQADEMKKREGMLDLAVDPPPELAIEIDVTTDSADKFAIYASLEIAEVWIFEDESLDIFLRDANGDYLPSLSSRSLPFLPVGSLPRFVAMADHLEKWDWIEQFETWLRDEVAPRR